MSWMQKLYETYNACELQGLAGKRDETPMLLPLYHGTQQAQLEVRIDGAGNWLPNSAICVEKKEQETLMPITEKSANRTSSPEPMPLFDKLVYVAGDYTQYVSNEKPEKEKKPYELYVEALRQWCESPFTHPDVQAWLKYVEKGCLIKDLITDGIFQADENGKMEEKWGGTGKATDAFVRVRVQQEVAKDEDRLWMNEELSAQWIAYQNNLPQEKSLCYVLGREMATSSMSPKYIRYPGDGAKLISANDSGGFTYRGRFANADEAFSIGRETTEKAHAALKYLIRRQGYRNGEQVILTFGTGGEPLPSIGEDTASFADNDFFTMLMLKAEFSLKESLARDVNKAVAGYQSRLNPQAEAIVMGLDSATPGRLSLFYYRETTAEDFLERVKRWHMSCSWEHRYRYQANGVDEKGKTVYRRITFCGAPAPIDIVDAAYGERASDKLKKSTVERLLPCIVDGARLPRDIVTCAARRAAQRAQLKTEESEKALSIACALIRKSSNDRKQEEVWDMALQPDVTDRSYLFGRAWAYAENIERYALQQAGENRSTNAERLMAGFARHPKRSWGILMDRLRPYQLKLGNRANALNEGMDAVICTLELEGFTDTPLDECYLLGYACQKQAFAQERNERIAQKNAQNVEEE